MTSSRRRSVRSGAAPASTTRRWVSQPRRGPDPTVGRPWWMTLGWACQGRLPTPTTPHRHEESRYGTEAGDHARRPGWPRVQDDGPRRGREPQGPRLQGQGRAEVLPEVRQVTEIPREAHPNGTQADRVHVGHLRRRGEDRAVPAQ